jgi:outer membrane receptor for monomeric catechols
LIVTSLYLFPTFPPTSAFFIPGKTENYFLNKNIKISLNIGNLMRNVYFRKIERLNYSTHRKIYPGRNDLEE